MWSQLWEEKSRYSHLTSVPCSLGGEVGVPVVCLTKVAMESDLPLFLPSGSFFSFLIVSKRFKTWGLVDCCSEVYVPLTVVPSSTLHGWSVLFYPPTLGAAVTFLGLWDDRYRKFKMSNALGIPLWHLSFHSGMNMPGRARWSQEEDNRHVEHRDTSLTPPAKPTSVSPQLIHSCVWEFP